MKKKARKARKKVRMVKVDSSNVRSVGYDESEKKLYVRFHSGGTYVYLNVPKALALEFIQADSQGKFINERIKDEYEYEFLTGNPPTPPDRLEPRHG